MAGNVAASTALVDMLDMTPLVMQVLTGMCVTLVASLVWYGVCKWIYRRDEVMWLATLQERPGEASLPIDELIALAQSRRATAGRGSPADRLFLGGLMVAGSIALAAVFALQVWAR